jgi:hypothetical protein
MIEANCSYRPPEKKNIRKIQIFVSIAKLIEIENRLLKVILRKGQSNIHRIQHKLMLMERLSPFWHLSTQHPHPHPKKNAFIKKKPLAIFRQHFSWIHILAYKMASANGID